MSGIYPEYHCFKSQAALDMWAKKDIDGLLDLLNQDAMAYGGLTEYGREAHRKDLEARLNG